MVIPGFKVHATGILYSRYATALNSHLEPIQSHLASVSRTSTTTTELQPSTIVSAVKKVHSHQKERIILFKNLCVAMHALAPYQHEPRRERSQVRPERPEREERRAGEENQRHGDARRLTSTYWCRCGRCVNLPLLRENICCRDIDDRALDKRKEEDGHDCITQHTSFGAD